MAANLTSFTDDISTNSDTVYAYRIRAFDGENFSAYSDTIAWFSTNSAPSSLQIEQMSQDTLQLTWQDNSIGEQYFRIDRKIDEKGWQMDYAHVPSDSTHFLDYTTSLYDTCNYKVFAVNGISQSDSTENAFIPFLPAPSNLQLQALGATQVKLTWQDNCHNEDGYRLYVKRGEFAEWDSINLAENIEELIDESVIPGIVNYYKVCAYYENDTSGFIEDNINTLSAPSNLTCSQQNVHTFELTWQDNSQFEQGFKIDRKIDNGEWTSPFVTTAVNDTTYTDSTIGRNYDTVYYKLSAYYETYNSDTLETNSNIAFPAPKNVEYEKVNIHSIKLTWDDYSQGETGFKIDKKVGVGIGEWQIEYAIVGENIQEWTDENAEINETLQYRIHAYCGENVSDYALSQEIDNTFPAPTDLTYLKIDIATIKLNWIDNSVGERGFKIDKKVGDGNWDLEYAELDENTQQWLDWTAEINEMIQYRVYAYYEDAVSDYEYSDEIDNAIPAPENLSYEIENENEVSLSWDYSLIGIDKFIIARKKIDNNWNYEYAEVDASVLEWSEVIDMEEYYIYKIKANFNDYYSEYSNEVFIDFIIDIDGNVYRTSIIGNQEWMSENLKVTHYRDGNPIPYLTDNYEWMDTYSGAYCVYDNEPSNIGTYGNIYNWYTVDDPRGLAPEGWHVPTDDDWQELVDFLGGGNVAGGKMKEAGTTHWDNPNTGATNESGFTALPGGYRSHNNGYYSNIGIGANFWSSTEYNGDLGWARTLGYSNSEVYRHNSNKKKGFSIRCLKD